MRKILLVLSLIGGMSLPVVVSAAGVASASSSAGARFIAADLVPGCKDAAISGTSACTDVTGGQGQGTSDNSLYGPEGVLTKAATIIAWISGVAAVIMIILGGFTFVTGSDDPNTLSAAKKTVLYAVIGIVVVLVPSTIIRFVLSKL